MKRNITAIIRFVQNLFVSLFFLLAGLNVFAQAKVDLETTVQTAVKSVRGGESFTYIITVKNIGAAKATDIILIQDEEVMTPFVSYLPSRGTCIVSDFDRRVQRRLHCKLTDLEAGESTIISVEMKIRDFGDVSMASDSMTPIEKKMLAVLSRAMDQSELKERDKSTSIGNIDVRAEESEEDYENNSARLSIELLPSKNIPPRVKVLSPKNEEVFTRSSKKPSAITFTIQAFDPDGTVERVEVNTQQLAGLNFSEGKYIIDGKKYSEEELEADKVLRRKLFGGDAVKTGKDTYTFTLENPQYGFNNIFIDAYDDGSRVGGTSVQLTVKGDVSSKFIKPLQDAIIKPQTDVVLETETRFNDGKPVKVELIGEAVCCAEVLMKEISRVGNVYRHQYVLKNVPKGRYGFQLLLMEDTGAFGYSEGVSFKITEKPTIKMTSLKNQQVFKAYENIPIEVEAADADGDVKDIVVSVNGEYGQIRWRENEYRKKGSIDGLPKGVYRIAVKVEDDSEVETESAPVTIVVK